jgi:phage head maturation protease
MRKIIGPPGWTRLSSEKRFAAIGSSPRTFNAEQRTVDCVLSKGSPVARPFGVEKLKISPSAVNLDRLATSGIPILDSHEQRGIANALGRLIRAWFDGRTLMGRIKFNETVAGLEAMGIVSRGEITGISIGYIVREWEIIDQNGRVLDPDADRIPLDGSLTFTATRYDLLEASLVSVPADSEAMIRSLGVVPSYIRDARARMRARQRMVERMQGRR